MDFNYTFEVIMRDQTLLSRRAIATANKLLATCTVATASSELSDADWEAFSRDKTFLEKAIYAFTSMDLDAINSIWHDVQHLSRFFGGNYVLHSNGGEDFERQCDELFDVTLELISHLRSQ